MGNGGGCQDKNRHAPLVILFPVLLLPKPLFVDFTQCKYAYHVNGGFQRQGIPIQRFPGSQSPSSASQDAITVQEVIRRYSDPSGAVNPTGAPHDAGK